MIASRKIKQRVYQLDKEKEKVKEEACTSDPNRDSQDAKIKEMSRLIRNISKNCPGLRLKVTMQIKFLRMEVLEIVIP